MTNSLGTKTLSKKQFRSMQEAKENLKKFEGGILPPKEEIEKCLEIMPVMKQYLLLVEKSAIEYLKSGVDIKGYTLGKRRSRPSCIDSDAFIEALKRLNPDEECGYFDSHLFMTEVKLLTKNKIVNFLMKNNKKGIDVVNDFFESEEIGDKLVKNDE